MRMWSQMVDQMLWPFAIKAAAERMNSLHIGTDDHTAESKFFGINIENIPVKTSVYATFLTADSTMQVQLNRQNWL
jgi:hypothetical protein